MSALVRESCYAFCTAGEFALTQVFQEACCNVTIQDKTEINFSSCKTANSNCRIILNISNFFHVIFFLCHSNGKNVSKTGTERQDLWYMDKRIN